MKDKQTAIKVTLSVIPQDKYWIEQVEKAIQSIYMDCPHRKEIELEEMNTQPEKFE